MQILGVRKRIEASCVHVPDAVFCLEIAEVFVESLPTVGQACGSGKAGACSDHDGVSIAELFDQPLV
jgi:hypothetical protein